MLIEEVIIIVFDTTNLSLMCLVRFNSHEIKFMSTLQPGGPDETNISHGSMCVDQNHFMLLEWKQS